MRRNILELVFGAGLTVILLVERVWASVRLWLEDA